MKFRTAINRLILPFVLTSFILLATVNNANSQGLLDKLKRKGEKALDKVENKINNRVDNAIDKKVDQSVDKVMEPVDGNSNNAAAGKEKKQQEQTIIK
ncbi:MAG: hypothetical protein EOP53_19210, partial [Sphingobacteriales bacterium]